MKIPLERKTTTCVLSTIHHFLSNWFDKILKFTWNEASIKLTINTQGHRPLLHLFLTPTSPSKPQFKQKTKTYNELLTLDYDCKIFLILPMCCSFYASIVFCFLSEENLKHWRCPGNVHILFSDSISTKK